MWHLAIEMKRRYQIYPLLMTPPHICGKRDNLLAVSQKAIDLDYDGLIIETHRDQIMLGATQNNKLHPKFY